MKNGYYNYKECIMITKEQAKDFINNYGNDDVFYSYRQNKNYVEVEYFPNLAKFVSSEALETFLKDYSPAKDNYGNILRTIIITDDCAVIKNRDKSTDLTLENNYAKFKQDIEELSM